MFGGAWFGSDFFAGFARFFGFVAPDTTTIYGPFQALADRLVISVPSSRVVNSTLGYSATFTDPASRLLIVTEEP